MWSFHQRHLKGTIISFSECTSYIARDNRWSPMLIKTKGQFLIKVTGQRFNTLLCSAYFDLYQIYNGLIIQNDFINLIIEALEDISSNQKHFFVKIQCGGWQPSWICWLQRSWIKTKSSPSYAAWFKTPIETYYMAIQTDLYGMDSFA